MKRSTVCLLILAFGSICLGPVLQAQTLGTIQGVVVDSSNARLPGVSVTIRNTDTGAEREVQTNAQGKFVVPALPSGTYSVIAELEGLQTAHAENQ